MMKSSSDLTQVSAPLTGCTCVLSGCLERTAAYKGWREQVKAYITVLGGNPTSLTGTQMDSVLSFARQRPIRVHNIRRRGATNAGYPCLNYPWYDEDSGGGIACQVLALPNLQSLL